MMTMSHTRRTAICCKPRERKRIGFDWLGQDWRAARGQLAGNTDFSLRALARLHRNTTQAEACVTQAILDGIVIFGICTQMCASLGANSKWHLPTASRCKTYAVA